MRALLACALCYVALGQQTIKLPENVKVVTVDKLVKQRPDTPPAKAPDVRPIMDTLKEAIAELARLRPPDPAIQPKVIEIPPVEVIRPKYLPDPPKPPVKPPFKWPKFDWTFDITPPRLDLSDLKLPKPPIPGPNDQPYRERLTAEDKYLMKEIMQAAKDYWKRPEASPAVDPYEYFKDFFHESNGALRDMDHAIRARSWGGPLPAAKGAAAGAAAEASGEKVGSKSSMASLMSLINAEREMERSGPKPGAAAAPASPLSTGMGLLEDVMGFPGGMPGKQVQADPLAMMPPLMPPQLPAQFQSSMSPSMNPSMPSVPAPSMNFYGPGGFQ